jgi:hypothetical protein
MGFVKEQVISLKEVPVHLATLQLGQKLCDSGPTLISDDPGNLGNLIVSPPHCLALQSAVDVISTSTT